MHAVPSSRGTISSGPASAATAANTATAPATQANSRGEAGACMVASPQNATGTSGARPWRTSSASVGEPFSHTSSIERLGLKPWWRQ
jgi:hypothetical protein